MSDYDTFTEMLNNAGIKWTVGKPLEAPQTSTAATKAIDVIADDGPHNLGYYGFYTKFLFDSAGGLLSIGAWE